MKAVLVIETSFTDIPTKDTVISYRIFKRQGNKELVHGCSTLKPLPNKITERGKWISEEYQKGWNAYREALGVTE